jgi:hypothetical protein
MASLLDKVKAAVANNTLMPSNYKDAIFASRNDPEVISFLQSIAPQTAPSVASSSPVSLFNQAAKQTSGYPDLRDRTSPLGSIARVLTGETPIVNPYLFNGVTRPVSEATKQVDMRNRNAQVSAQNQAMGNTAQALGGIFNGDGRTAENTAGTTNTTGAGLASLLPMIQGRSPSMVGQGIQSTATPDGKPSFIDKAVAAMGSSRMPSFSIPDITLPEGIKVDDRGLPDSNIYAGVGNAFTNDPMVKAIAGGFDSLNANQTEGFEEWLKTPAGRMWETSQAQGALRRSTPTTPLGKSLENQEVMQEVDETQATLKQIQEDIVKEVKERPPTVPTGTDKTDDKTDVETTEAAKKLNTGATVVSPQEPEAKKDWFNAINDRIDLMAMGAAMLAGSGQRGATTMSRLGEGLQAGLASRAAEAKDAEDKQYKDALLLLKTMDQRRLLAKDKAAGIPDPFKNKGAQVDRVGGNLRNVGVSGDNISVLANQLWSMSPQLATMPYDATKEFYEEFAKIGQGWVGSTIDSDDVVSAANKAIENIKSRQAAK